ncbi:MAG: hypothetical protein HYX66_09630 [Ignavibacteria bacterium]|nr:hypothetical protein [Ignavibacteria bacterium]
MKIFSLKLGVAAGFLSVIVLLAIGCSEDSSKQQHKITKDTVQHITKDKVLLTSDLLTYKTVTQNKKLLSIVPTGVVPIDLNLWNVTLRVTSYVVINDLTIPLGSVVTIVNITPVPPSQQPYPTPYPTIAITDQPVFVFVLN